ncbi:response regulator transcription factor [Thiorhodococcus mannitoliphagus]|uniref:Response regulator transcription factor n=1 Tax=Thiorhodococcus mannitoliphagus TaxID=329406 RepID=A0A6P1DUJ1_9GAMM|nr:response regulator [Thiorhodococcus mannitoliphagus]NEX21140.1 response regulator transcription factor [Thiorhodococcus mannitoliphagus]
MADVQTVFLVDDDQGMRDSLTLILELAGYRVKSFASPMEFLEVLSPQERGCLLLDQRMPEMSGLDLQGVLLERGCLLPIIFLSAFGDVPTTVRAMQGGAIDFLEKPATTEVLLQRIQTALAEDQRRREESATEQSILERFRQLTPREHEVLTLTTQGLTNKDIARELGISPRTVENHRARMMEKMGAANLAELCRMATVCQPSTSTR